MNCPACPGVTAVKADVYHREDNDARIPCTSCGAEIHFGPAIMTLRDPDDPVLDDDPA
jgi:hypothetical protein